MIGEVVGNFRVIGELGRGGMGEVWLAEHKDIKTRVAIKLLLPHISADKQQVDRFFNEAVAVGKIKHAGIARISDVGFHSGRAYLVMELLEGEPLSRRLHRTGRLPVDQLCDIARQIASVLEATHAAGIIHRDLKPDNVFIVSDAELASGERVKVLDFGIAKLTGNTAMTGTANAMGTPAYMSPEQWRSSGKVDGRADVYSLGCLVFELAAGRPPFLCESIGDACDKHLNAAPPPLRSLVPELPDALAALVAQLLAKQPEWRPAIRDVKAAFASFGGPSPSFSTALPAAGTAPTIAAAAPSSTTLQGSAVGLATAPPGPAKSRRWALAVAAAVVVAGAAVVVAATGRGGSAPPASERAAAVTAAAAPAPAPPAAPAQPATPPAPSAKLVHLHIAPIPTNAVVRIDGATVDDPADIPLARDDADHRLEVSAPGFVSDVRLIPVSQDHAIAITLKPTADAAGSVGHPVVTRPSIPTPVTVAPPAPPPPVAPPPPPSPDDGKKIYKGTKGTIITDYPGGK